MPSPFVNDGNVASRFKIIATASIPELNHILDDLHRADALMPDIPQWKALQARYHDAVVQRNLKLLQPRFSYHP